jgi:ABC-2 type transport system permease protein
MIVGNIVAGKDLRTRMRGRRAGVVLTLYLCALGVTALVVLIAQSSNTTFDPMEAGARLFQALALVQLLVVLILTPLSFAASVSAERERNTWDLLLLSRLTSSAIVLGKFAAGLAFSVLLLIAGLPLFALSFLFRSFSLGQFAQMYTVLVATVLLLGSIGLLISVLVASVARALAWSGIVAAALSAGLTGLILGAANGGAPILGRYQLWPQWARLAPLDPVAALISALPDARSVMSLGTLATVGDSFGLPVPVWGAYAIAAALISALLLLLATHRIRISDDRLAWPDAGRGR